MKMIKYNIHSNSFKRILHLYQMKLFNSKLYQFKTHNNEFYIAENPNEYYQSLRTNSYKGITFSLQDQLPSLPIPDLNDTLNKYLLSIKPFIQSVPFNDNDEYQRQVQLCNDFIHNLGPILQKRLIQYSSNKRNWLSNWWDSQAYLNSTDPLFPYVSYFFNHSSLTFSPLESNNNNSTPLVKATALIQSILKFIESIKDESLPPEFIKFNNVINTNNKFPLCMNSFHFMFNSSRVPNTTTTTTDNIDTSVFYSIFENDFIVVAYKGNFFKMFTHDNGTPLQPNIIYHQLNDIVHSISSQNNTSDSGVGILTSLPRDQWRSHYLELIKDPTSKSSLETIHRASFILCLDLDVNPVTLVEKARNSWHGNGSNRFFDKFLQFFVTGNAKTGFLGEHSKMDGTPTLFLNDFICQDLSNLNQFGLLNQINCPIVSSSSRWKPQLLKFNLSPNIKRAIVDAKSKFISAVSEHDLTVWRYQRYGKNFIKRFKLSPDSYIQQIIQLAMYKYLGKQLPTYEPASTRKFFKGRTETGRAVTMDSYRFVSNWSNPNLTSGERLSLLQRAIFTHSKVLKTAAEGLGIDRHFLGLRNMLNSKDHEEPALFNDPLFKYSSTWYISTSQLSSEYFDGYGWSEVNDAGVGLAYMVNKDRLHINIVNKPALSGFDGNKIFYYLTEAADEMADLLIQHEKLIGSAKL